MARPICPPGLLLLTLGCCFATVAQAQIPTGQNNNCCAFIDDGTPDWQLVCSDPANVPGAIPFPAGTVISAYVNDLKRSACTGRFPFSIPAPYRLPATGKVEVGPTPAPNGGRCAGSFTTFYQWLRYDGLFQVQCT